MERRDRRLKVFKGDNPAARVKLFKEKARERFLTPEELMRVNEALLAEPEPWRSIFPARPADWDSADGTVDGAVGERRPGRAHSEADRDQERAQSLATAARCCRGHSGGATEPRTIGMGVSPGRSASGHVTEPKSAWSRIRERAGVADVRIHDLRRTLGSWLAGAGFSLPMIGRALGHQSPSSTASMPG